MHNITTFNHDVFGKVRAILINEEPYFYAKDIADILGYSKTNSMLKRLENDEKKHLSADEIRRLHNGAFENINNTGMTMVNEPGFYVAVIGSGKKEAKQFIKWITHDVLPSLRQEGIYVMDNATKEQKLYHYKLLDTTFSNCDIERLPIMYEECIKYYNLNKIRLPYQRKVKGKRKNSKHTIANTKIMVLKKIKEALEKREYKYKVKDNFALSSIVNDVLKKTINDIRKIQHNKTKGKLAASSKALDN
ncbi:Bro-N domain-containing protein [Bacillus velezensis]